MEQNFSEQLEMEEKYFCAVCAREYPKNSRCLGAFVKGSGDPPNHIEDCKTEEQLRLWIQTPDLFGVIGFNNSKLDYDRGYEAGRKFAFEDIPMGVNQWRNHGKKWGYWEWFEKQARLELLDEKNMRLMICAIPSQSGSMRGGRLKRKSCGKKTSRSKLTNLGR